MKKFREVSLIVGGGAILLLFCCGLFLLFFDGYYLPYKPCRPLEFPSLEKISFPKRSKIYEYRTNQPIDEVVELFDNRLHPLVLSREQPLGVGVSDWKRKQLNSKIQVYQCISADINGSTLEQGCLYIRKTRHETAIQMMFGSFETSTFSCDSTTVAPLSTPQY